MSITATADLSPAPAAAPEQDFSVFFREDGQGGTRMDFAVEGITCAACIGEIEALALHDPAVSRARVNYSDRRLAVSWAPEHKPRPALVMGALKAKGYVAHPFDPASAEARESAALKELLRCLGVAAFATMNIMLLSVSVWSGNASDIDPLTRDFFHWLSALIALPAVAYAGRPFFRSAARAIANRQLNMDVPIALGVTLAIALSLVETMHHGEHAYFDSATMLLFFLLTGRVLEHVMRRKTRAVASNLLALRSETALAVQTDGSCREVPVSALKAGDRVLVRPGERIAVDGLVVDGVSTLDQSLVTGETQPVSVTNGMSVQSGTLNLSGALTLEVASAAHMSFLDEVNRLLAQAVEDRSRYVQLADRAARLYSPVVHLTAFTTFTGWVLLGLAWQQALVIAITVLIITCPCALGLAIPTVQVVASGALFRARVLLNGGEALERLAEADTIVFDKTGTLTLPLPQVSGGEALSQEALALAGRLALSSRHPLAMALAKALDASEPLSGVNETAGEGLSTLIDGVEARLGRPSFCDVADDGAQGSRIAFRWGDQSAVLGVAQALRPDAVETVARLKRAGYRMMILSGDKEAAVQAVAQTLGLEDARSALRPDDKIAVLKALKAEGRKPLMVGDGLNDAPALASAHVSLSPVSAVHLTQAQADAVFLGESLRPVADALALARRARMLMSQNLWLAVVYNAIAVPLAILGYVTPLVAALAMSGSSLIVTLNALRGRASPGDI